MRLASILIYAIQLDVLKVHYFCRDKSDVDHLVKSTFRLPALTVEHQPLYVRCGLPAYGQVNEPFQLIYTLYNRTGYVQEFEANMENCDSFVFSGHKQVADRCSFRLVLHDDILYKWLNCGLDGNYKLNIEQYEG